MAGAFVFSAGLGLVATNCINAFSYGYDKLRFIKPTFIGDTIYTIRASYPGNSNYTSKTVDAIFTIGLDPLGDADNDGIPNGVEAQLGTDPRAAKVSDLDGSGTQLKINRPLP